MFVDIVAAPGAVAKSVPESRLLGSEHRRSATMSKNFADAPLGLEPSEVLSLLQNPRVANSLAQQAKFHRSQLAFV